MATNKSSKNYQKLCKCGKEAALYTSALRLLEWDQETHMPKEGLPLRAEQNQVLHERIHKLKTSKSYASLLSSLEKDPHLSPQEKAVVRECARDYAQVKNLPLSFVKKMTETTTLALSAWKEAKNKGSFSIFAPHLKKIVSLLQKKADLLGYKDHPYDALLNLFEPEMNVKTIDPLFASLKNRTHALLKKVEEADAKAPPLQGPFDIDAQKQLAYDVIQRMGIPTDQYNLAQTAHPFCLGLYPHDIRLTTHYYEDNFLKSFLAAVHEAGHGLYEQGLPKEHFGTPLCEAASFGVHESQSRIWETFIAHSLPFWQFYFPKIHEAFPKALHGVTLPSFYHSINQVAPSFIRIFADEVTYNLHIILRYEMEKELISGTLAIKDVPEAWNAKMQENLGITPKNDRDGCLQDIHWSLAYMGYFPSYTLGNLYAGALFSTLTKNHPEWTQKVSHGDFLFIKEFLNKHIHQHGRFYLPLELIEKAIGKPFSAEYYLSYLEDKYPLSPSKEAFSKR